MLNRLVIAVLLLAFAGCGSGQPPRKASTIPGELFGGFEHGVSGWVPLGGAQVSQTTDERRFGSAALQIVTTGFAQYGAYVPSLLGNPTSGAEYRLSLWIRSNDLAMDRKLLVEFTESGGKAMPRNIARKLITLRSEWLHVSVAGRVRDRDRSHLSLSMTQVTNINAGGGFYVDGVTLRISD